MTEDEHRVFKSQWSFDWDALEVMIGGKSAIDLHGLKLKSWHQATLFVKGYGYDPDYAPHAQIIHAAIIEAFYFLEQKLMPTEWAQGYRPDPEIMAITDVRQLLLWASEARTKTNRLRRAWSCTLLRVLHTIAHINSAYRLLTLSQAHDYIMNRFNRYISTEGGGLWFGAGHKKVLLHHLEWKHAKTRESILLKLLHKKANVAETIYDLMGIRIITLNLGDCIRVVENLKELNLINFPNTHPARGRNNLIDFEVFRNLVETLGAEVHKARISQAEFHEQLAQALKEAEARLNQQKDNPHSAQGYKAIQLTCKEPIPLNSYIFSQANHGNKLGQQELWLRTMGLESLDYATLFPFEIQIMDKAAFEKNQAGSAAHERYKQSQLKAARRRVLQRVLRIFKEVQKI